MKQVNFRQYTKCRDHGTPRAVKAPIKVIPLPTYRMDPTTSIKRIGAFKIKKKLDVLASSKPTLKNLFKDN